MFEGRDGSFDEWLRANMLNGGYDVGRDSVLIVKASINEKNEVSVTSAFQCGQEQFNDGLIMTRILLELTKDLTARYEKSRDKSEEMASNIMTNIFSKAKDDGK